MEGGGEGGGGGRALSTRPPDTSQHFNLKLIIDSPFLFLTCYSCRLLETWKKPDDGKCITKIIHKSHLLLTTSHLVRNEKYQGSLSYCTCSHSSPRDESVSFPDHLSHLDRTFLLLRLPRARRGHTGRPSGVGSADYGLEKTLVNTWLKGALESVFTKEVILTFH